MPITLSEFNAISHKVITLMGMSGVGKTYLSTMLGGEGWYHYSCDLEIGTRFLGDEVVSALSKQRGVPVENTITAGNLSLLSDYVARLGDPARGGLPIDEFRRRQKQYFEAECKSLLALKDVVKQAHEEGYVSVINDSTGSMCEIDDQTLLDSVDENSLIVYIKASPEEEKQVLKRAQTYPKPLFYSPERFDEWLDSYLTENALESADYIDPDDFSRWVFPRLFENRLPKYQRIADQYGVTIPSEAFKGVTNEAEFMHVITSHLKETL